MPDSVVTGGSEFQVNTFTAGIQAFPKITGLDGGGFVISWWSEDQDGSSQGVYAQMYDVAGVAQGGEFRVNTFTTGNQSDPAITALDDGGFVVSWTSFGQDGSGDGIYAQRYDAAGAAQGGEFRVNATTTNVQSDPAIATLDDGGFVVSWQSTGQDGSDYGIYAQRYDATGVAQGGEFPVNTFTTSAQSHPEITALEGDGFVVSWESNGQDGSFSGIYAQRYDAAGVAQGGEFLVNAFTSNSQSAPAIAALNGGGFVVSWMSDGQDGSDLGIYAQRYDAAGVADGGEFRVNTFTTEIQADPAITALNDGGFVISWTSPHDGSGYGVYAQLYDAAGAPDGGEFLINPYTESDQAASTITALDGGGFAVSWSSFDQDGSSYGVYARTFAVEAANTAPTLEGVSPAVTFLENTVNAAPQILDADVTFNDAEDDLDGGNVTVSGGLAEDIIAINNEGTGAGQIGVAGTNVTYGGVTIGTVAGGTGGTSLVVTLNAAATSAAVEALIENLTYANISDTPTLDRTLTINVTDAAGADLNGGFVQGPFVELTGADDPLANPPLPTFGVNPNPAFLDVDGDGDQDMIMGDQTGLLRYFQSDGGGYTEQTGAANPFDGVDVGTFSTPVEIDIDGDGDDDLISGGLDGLLRTFLNNGAGSWTQLIGNGVNPFHSAYAGVGGDAGAVDVNGDGRMDLLTGDQTGFIDVFLQNADHSFTQQFGADNPFDGVDIGNFSSPAGADVDGDGDMDVVFGNSLGVMRTFLNDGNGAFVEVIGAANPFDGIDVGSYSSVSFADLDGDGDADLVVSTITGGDTRVFENSSTTASAPQIVVTVTPENDVPAATDDALVAVEDTPVTYPASDLLGNDSDAEGDVLSVTDVFNVVGGIAVLNGDGSVTFTPDADYTGPAGFDYEVSDPGGASDIGHATIAITPVDDAPVAVADVLGSTDEDNAITYAASALTGNDTDIDGGPLFIASVGNAIGGDVVLNGDGSVTFTPAPDYNGPASFDYTLNGGSSATATFVVNPVSDVVAVNDGAVLIDEGGTVDLWNLVLGNDFDPEGDSFTITSVGTGGTSGTVTFDAATQTLIYVADGAAFDALAPGDVVVDSFTYTITDSTGATDTATVVFNVTATADGTRTIGSSDDDTMAGSSGEDYLDGRGGNDVINGGAEEDTLIGGSGNDTLDGGSGNDDLTGGSGRDVLKGGLGADDLDGGSGDDLLWGGAGDDSLTGGSGADRFEIGSNEGDDIITDFDVDADVLALLTGTTVQSSSVSDTNGDGFDDLVIDLSTGGTVTLLHVDDFASVTIETVTTIPSESFA